MGPRARVRVLGSVAIEIDGLGQQLGGPRQRAVLAMLALESNRFVTVDRLIVDLWDDDSRRQPKNNVQVYVSNLRRLLRDVEDEVTIVGESGGYRLVAAPGVVDLDEFDRLVAEGRAQLERGLAQAATRTLRAADALWTGALVDDLAARFDVFVRAAEVARERRLNALELQMSAGLQAGRAGELVADLERLTALHPLRERFWIQLITALYRSGRQAHALSTYHRARQTLADEAGLDPGLELRQLEAAVLSGKLALRDSPTTGLHLRYVDANGSEIRVPLIAGSSYEIGRQPTLDISVEWDAKASRVHARLFDQNGRWMLVDCGSTNGTRLNGTQISSEVTVSDGDVFVVGVSVFTVMESTPLDHLPTISSVTMLARRSGTS